MYLLLPLFLLFAAYFMGSMIKKLLRDPEQKLSESVLVGTLFIFLLWEFLVLPAIKLNASFDAVSRIYSGLLLLLFILAVFFCGKEIRRQWKSLSIRFSGMFFALTAMVALQIAFFFLLEPDVTGDFTVETVNTTLQSDMIYENHPGMGDTFVYGITFRGKLVSLPLFYAYLKDVFSGEIAFLGESVFSEKAASLWQTAALVYRMIPTWCLLLSYMAYALWADVFFDKTENRENRTALFFLGVGFLNIFGSLSEDSVFYYQMFRGFRGETFVFSVLIPYAIYLCWQIYGNKKNYSVIYLIMIGLTTLILTDYQKGFIPFMTSVLICSAIAVGYKIRRWLHCRS